jgi:hypothetical protein
MDIKIFNMKYSRLFSALVLLVLINSSCEKVLDNKPQDFLQPEAYYNTEVHLNTALNGVYAILADNATYCNYMLGRMGLEGDEGFPDSDSDLLTVTYYNTPAADVKVLQYWTALYAGINRANLLLQNIDKPQMNEDNRNNIRGQALFLRAYYYFMLVNKFGDVPLLLETKLSGKVEDVQVPRTPAKQVYEQIIKDMTTAADLVSPIDAVSSAGRVSQSAVWGILARVCLHMAGNPVNETAKFAEAAMWAKKVIDGGKHVLNPSYEQIFTNYAQDKYDFKESIFEVEFWGNATGIYTNTGGMVGRLNGVATSDPAIGIATGVIHTTPWMYNAYGAGDLRRDWSIAPYRYVGVVKTDWPTITNVAQRFCGKFRRELEILTPKGATYTPQNFPLLRYSDVLLMYAEADNEVNGPNAANIEAVNSVRRRGYGKLLPGATNITAADLPSDDIDTKINFRDAIRDERARELSYEALRKNDLVRWGIFLNRMKSSLAEVNTGTAALLNNARLYYSNASERDVLWPLPAYDMGINRKLVQNPGW